METLPLCKQKHRNMPSCTPGADPPGAVACVRPSSKLLPTGSRLRLLAYRAQYSRSRAARHNSMSHAFHSV
eukprot:874564-Pelagomonas_calceolata.AAC.2